jgi:class 3 adenylate cyclase
VKTCPRCGEGNEERAHFCWSCGEALAEERPAGEERKVVSVLFVDLVGFTARSDRADPEDVRATLGPYHTRLRAEIERFGGTVEKFVGDAVMAVFGAPVTHEDDAERAIRAGLRIISDFGAAENPLMVRVGIETGLVVLGPVGGGGRVEYGAHGRRAEHHGAPAVAGGPRRRPHRRTHQTGGGRPVRVG